ncbi:MAG: regulatory protein RecX [Arachnia sp.]
MTSNDEEVARTIAVRLLDAKPRTVAELRTALAKRNVPTVAAEAVITRFIEVGLLNDGAYAEALTATRSRTQLRGRRRISQELRQRGVDDETIAAAIESLDPEAELAAARQAAERKARSLGGLDPMVAKRRLYGALERRGFSFDVVRQAADEVLG